MAAELNKSSEGRVKVFCRIRPPLPREEASAGCIRVDEEKRMVEVSDEGNLIDRVLGGGSVDTPVESKSFEFDGVFGGVVSQKQVFSEVGLDACREVLKGFNGCIFAYGQTGAGKTHSLLASGGPNGAEDAGILPRVVATLFVQIQKDVKYVYEVEAAAMQIYNEQVDDLLNPDHSKGSGQNLNVREGGVVQSLTWEKCGRPDSLMELVQRARSKIVYAETKMNKASSRSHAVFQIRVTRRQRAGANDGAQKMKTTFGTLSIVDLAGSERVKRSGVVGKEFKEATNINGSLLALGNVVSALASKQKHVPFRDSKLTRILQSSIGGNCKTSMLVCASPAAESAQETIGSLEFASRAMKVVQEASVNEGLVEVNASQLAKDLAGDDLACSSEALAEQKKLSADLEQRLEQKQRDSAAAVAMAQKAAEKAAGLADKSAAEARRLKEEVADVNKKEAEARSQMSKVRAEAEETKSRLAEVEAAAKTAAAKAEEKQKDLTKDFQKQQDALSQSLKETEAKRQSAESLAEDRRKELEKTQAEVTKTKKELADAIQRSETAEKALAAERTQLSSDIDTQKADLEKVRAEAAKAEADAKEFHRQCAEALERGNGLEAQLANANEELSRRAAALDDASAALKKLRRDADSAEERLIQSHEAAFKAAAVAHRAEIENLKEERAVAEKAMMDAHEQLKERHIKEQEEMQEAWDAECRDHRAAAEAAQLHYEAEARKVDAMHKEALATIEAKHAEQKATWESDRLQLQENYSCELETQRNSFEAQLQKGRQEFESKLVALESEMECERQEFKAKLEEKAAELEQKEAAWNESKESALKEAWETGNTQQRRLAAAFKAARNLKDLKEAKLQEEHDDLARRFQARESREEDVSQIKEQLGKLTEQEQLLAARGQVIGTLALEAQNRDINDRIFGSSPVGSSSTHKRRLPAAASRSPRRYIPPLPGKKVGDTRQFPERRLNGSASCRSASADRIIDRPLRMNLNGSTIALDISAQ
eukprot:gnl/MRDRNA2_/MRDRNA2_29106_c0_seq1.p1 gnl/MRDRNA2_/MRDRNA2_29106_c0~~gnl/MRDRNA2_/MRDRNA2_29106_c0_seq1.p1  ORF type:complete len:1000 (+),score=320.89 gnl/MRDRNA2_/MRDRNA2_29106_c0_seq1:99-3098(+)